MEIYSINLPIPGRCDKPAYDAPAGAVSNLVQSPAPAILLIGLPLKQ